MRIFVRVNKFYDSVPLPSDVEMTPEEEAKALAKGKLKPDAAGVPLMRVTRGYPSTTEVFIPEDQIVEKILHEKCRPGEGRTLTRKQAVALYMSENVMPLHAHRKWIADVQVHDDGVTAEDEKYARAKFAEHVAADNIPAEDVEEHMAAYLEKADAKAHEDHLRAHFRIAKAVAS